MGIGLMRQACRWGTYMVRVYCCRCCPLCNKHEGNACSTSACCTPWCISQECWRGWPADNYAAQWFRRRIPYACRGYLSFNAEQRQRQLEEHAEICCRGPIRSLQLCLLAFGEAQAA